MTQLYLCVHSFPYSFTLWFITEYWIESPVLYGRTLLFIHPTYNSLYLLIPNSQSLPPHPLPLGTCDRVVLGGGIWAGTWLTGRSQLWGYPEEEHSRQMDQQVQRPWGWSTPGCSRNRRQAQVLSVVSDGVAGAWWEWRGRRGPVSLGLGDHGRECGCDLTMLIWCLVR